MTRKKTIRSLQAEIANVDARIERFTRARNALIEVITYLDEVETRLGPGDGPGSSADTEAEGGAGSDTPSRKPSSLPALPRERLEAVRVALAAQEK